MGTNFIAPFRSLIQEWFQRGENDKGQNISAPMMAKEITRLFPHRYDVPSVYQITSVLTALLELSKYAVRLRRGASTSLEIDPPI